jgi:hypothetical protein
VDALPADIKQPESTFPRQAIEYCEKLFEVEDEIEKLTPDKKKRQHQKEGLMKFLIDGNITISNNLAENSIRPFTVGRRNWLFSGSPEGAAASAVVYSIVETAKANNINPYEYLRYIFKYLPGVRFIEEPEFLKDFMPWNPDVQAFRNKTEKRL